jgi:hypothetical protein
MSDMTQDDLRGRSYRLYDERTAGMRRVSREQISGVAIADFASSLTVGTAMRRSCGWPREAPLA